MANKKKTKGMGKTIDTDDFLLIRPNLSYRTNSNVLVLKGENPIIIDVGTPYNPGAKKVEKELRSRGYNAESVQSIIISHSHQDHFQDLPLFRSTFQNAKVYCHSADEMAIKYPFLIQNAWKTAMKINGYSNNMLKVYTLLYMGISPFYFRNISTVNTIDYLITQNTKIGKNPKVEIIPTPGHTKGHLSVLDSKGNYFLLDMVPFTPWIDPYSDTVDLMLKSIDNILETLKYRVKRVVRAHGDYRFENWEQNTPEFEIQKFEFFKRSIVEMMEKLPKFLKKPRRIEEIAQFINPNYAKYDKIMKLFFIPPAISWAMAYCLKLNEEGKISYKKKPLYRIWYAN